MNVEIISHDTTTGQARIKFSHLDVVHEADYNLKLVIPGSENVLTQMGQEFTKELQLKALDRLTEWLTRDIESGALKNPLPEAALEPTPAK
jgi:hypothetical protein